MSIYILIVFEKMGEKLIDESFEVVFEIEVKIIGIKKLEEFFYLEKMY